MSLADIAHQTKANRPRVQVFNNVFQEINMTRLVTISLFVTVALTLSACNTWKGFGQDLQKVGQKVQKQGDKVNQ
jgi:predicted small secreted protein